MYDPKDLLKLYVYGYMNRIRSSRRLEKESRRNLEAIWLLRRLSPDHKTISRFRSDNASALKNVFRDFGKLCMKLGLYGAELVAIDGSKFGAVNSKSRNFTAKKLAERIAALDAKIDEYFAELDRRDSAEGAAPGGKPAVEIAAIVAGLSERKKVYEGYAEELERTGERQKSLTDSDSRLMVGNGSADVGYNVQTAVDSKNKLVVEFEVTNSCNDSNQLTPMSAKAKDALGASRLSVVADAGYDSASDIAASIGGGIDVHVAGTDYDICVPTDEQGREEVVSHHKGRCAYVAERNVALCPMGHVLYPRSYNKKEKYGIYYNSGACRRCACKCTKSRVQRHRVFMAESAFSTDCDDKDIYVKQVRVAADKELVRRRKAIVEHPFGTVKRGMDAGYCLTKGIEKVRGEFSLAFLAYGLKRVINIVGARELISCMAAA